MSLLTRGLGEPGSLVTRGLASPGVRIPAAGGVVLTEAVALLTDLDTLTGLITQVEEALAPVVEALLTETDLVLSLDSSATMALDTTAEAVLGMALSEQELILATDDTDTTTLTDGYSTLVALEADAAEETPLSGSQEPSATLDDDTRLSGEPDGTP